jgi:regulator of ribosome biosynthesis
MDSDAGKIKRARTESSGGGGGDDTVNVRKAVRFASKGRGGAALGRENAGKGRGRGKK